jgi:hypothetical protein
MTVFDLPSSLHLRNRVKSFEEPVEKGRISPAPGYNNNNNSNDNGNDNGNGNSNSNSSGSNHPTVHHYHHYHHFEPQEHIHIHHNRFGFKTNNKNNNNNNNNNRKRLFLPWLLVISFFGGFTLSMYKLNHSAHKQLQSPLSDHQIQQSFVNPAAQARFVRNSNSNSNNNNSNNNKTDDDESPFVLEPRDYLVPSDRKLLEKPLSSTWNLVMLKTGVPPSNDNDTAAVEEPPQPKKMTRKEAKARLQAEAILDAWCPQPFSSLLESPRLIRSSDYASIQPPDPHAPGIFHYSAVDYNAFYDSANVDERLKPVAPDATFVENVTVVELKLRKAPVVKTAAICKIRSTATSKLQHFAHAMEELYKCFDYWIDSGCTHKDATNVTPILLYDKNTQGKPLMYDSFLQNTFMKGVKEFLVSQLGLSILKTDDYYQCHFGGSGVGRTIQQQRQQQQQQLNGTGMPDLSGQADEADKLRASANFYLNNARNMKELEICQNYYHPDQTIRTHNSMGENGYLFQHAREWNDHIDNYLTRKRNLKQRLDEYRAQHPAPSDKESKITWKKERNAQLRAKLLNEKREREEPQKTTAAAASGSIRVSGSGNARYLGEFTAPPRENDPKKTPKAAAVAAALASKQKRKASPQMAEASKEGFWSEIMERQRQKQTELQNEGLLENNSNSNSNNLIEEEPTEKAKVRDEEDIAIDEAIDLLDAAEAKDGVVTDDVAKEYMDKEADKNAKGTKDADTDDADADTDTDAADSMDTGEEKETDSKHKIAEAEKSENAAPKRRRLTSEGGEQQPFFSNKAVSVLAGACARPPRIGILNRRKTRIILNAADLALDLSEMVYVYERTNKKMHGDHGATANATNTTTNNTTFEYVSPVPIEATFFEKKSFVEQVEYFRNTDILISGHGAQLTGLAFMANDLDANGKSCKQVMEFFPKNYALPYYFGSLAVQSGLDHSYVYYDDGLGTIDYQHEVGVAPRARPPPKTLTKKRSPLVVLKPWERDNVEEYKDRMSARKYKFCPRRDDMLDYVAQLVLEWYRCHGC